MSANSLGLLAIVVPLDGAASYTFSPQDSLASLTGIPKGGTTLHLPADPGSGDRYEFCDLDGSCSATHPIILTAASGTTIRGFSATSITFSMSFSSGACVFDETRKTWAVVSSANANPNSILQTGMFNNNAAVALTSGGVTVLQGNLTIGAQDTGLFVSGFIPVVNADGPVTEGAAQAVLLVDGVTQDDFAPVQDFGTLGSAAIHLSALTQLSLGDHTIGLQGSAPTTANLIVPIQGAHLTFFRLGTAS